MSFWKPAPVSQQQYNERLEGEGGGEAEAGAAASWIAASSSSRGSRGRRGSRINTPLAQQRMLLPIYKHRNQILYAVEEYDVVVIVGETGCGKSTQLPQYLVGAEEGGGGGWADNDFCVLCTQPRRIAAITLAERVAVEMGTPVGDAVGYSVRFDHKYAGDPGITKIKYVTDGMLLREATLSDPLLSQYSVVIVDEAHERSLDSDAVLGLLKKIRRKRRDLRIVVCSATLDAQAFVDFFVGSGGGGGGGGSKPKKHQQRKEDDDDTETGTADRKRRRIKGRDDNGGENELKATIISVDGRQYPVDVLYLARPAPNYLQAVVETAHKIVQQQQKQGGTTAGGGDILCFLPSGEDIDQAIRMAEEDYFKDSTSIDLLPLYGTLPYHMQVRVFQTDGGNSNRRRIIFATNIAETSVTVPNISSVIDSGLVKLPFYDPKSALERLIVSPVSRASAQQRAGRAGRVRSGKCYRLYTESYLANQMDAQTPPEILRTNLTSFILTLKALGVDNILAFDLMDVPSVEALSHGLETLYALGAIDDRTHLTDLGMDVSTFPTDPRVSRMLLESLSSGCSWEVLAVASALQVRDLFFQPRALRSGYGGGSSSMQQQQLLDYETAMAEVVDPSGDHVTYANLLAEMDDRDLNEQECRDRFVNYLALKRAVEVRRQLSGVLRKFGRIQAMGLAGDDGNTRSRAIRRCVAAGFFGNVAKLANDGRYYTLRKKILVTPSSSSVLALSSRSTAKVSEYIVFGETVDGKRGGIELKAVSSIEARWLRELAPHYYE